jgi:hypothetical protein
MDYQSIAYPRCSSEDKRKREGVTTSAERGMSASPPSSRVVMWTWGLQSLGSAIKQHLLGEHVADKGVAALLGRAQHKVGLAHQVQECQPLLVHSQPPVLPGGESALGAQRQGAVEDARIVADVGALEQGLVLGTQRGIVALLQHSPATTTARIFSLGHTLARHLGHSVRTPTLLQHTPFWYGMVWQCSQTGGGARGGAGSPTAACPRSPAARGSSPKCSVTRTLYPCSWVYYAPGCCRMAATPPAISSSLPGCYASLPPSPAGSTWQGGYGRLQGPLVTPTRSHSALLLADTKAPLSRTALGTLLRCYPVCPGPYAQRSDPARAAREVGSRSLLTTGR